METEPSWTFLCTQDWKLDIYIVKNLHWDCFKHIFIYAKVTANLILTIRGFTNFSKEFFLMGLSASGALYFTQNNINRNNKYMQQQKKLEISQI